MTRDCRLRVVTRTGLGKEVSASLREAILAGTLPPGARLVEDDLAADLGVSRGPVREALRELATDRLVVITPGRGSSVAVFNREDIEEIYSLRSALEGVGARWLAQTMTERKGASLQAILHEMNAAPDSESIRELDLEFHRMMAEMSEHRRVASAWAHLAPQISFCMHRLHDVYPDRSKIIDDHAATLHALLNRDADQAERMLRTHIEDAGQRVLAVWQDCVASNV